jgi:hypothetical protein
MVDAIDFKWYRYTADDGTFFALKVNKTWGDDVDSGFTAFNTADPAIAPSPSFRPRSILMQDVVSGRVTKWPVGTTAAAAWTTSGFTQTAPVRGGIGTVTFTKIGNVGERVRRPRTIISKPEPISA